jgi:acetyl esterase/lipase
LGAVSAGAFVVAVGAGLGELDLIEQVPATAVGSVFLRDTDLVSIADGILDHGDGGRSTIRAASLDGGIGVHVDQEEPSTEVRRRCVLCRADHIARLHDEALDYAARLREAGVPVTVQRILGLPHGFARMINLIPEADAAVSDAAAHIRQACSQLVPQ